MAQTAVRKVVELVPGQKFSYDVQVSIGDTNMEQNVYWVRFLEWFGKARETFLLSIYPIEKFAELFAQGGRIITHETQLKHLANAYFGDEVVLEMRFTEVKRASVKMLVDFIKKSTGEKIATGWQTLVYADKNGEHVAPIPTPLKEAVLQFAVPNKMG